MKNNQGSALVISLILLMMMTFIGMIGIQSSLLEEKMSSNMKEHDLAFQAAEIALKTGENLLKQQAENLVFQSAANQQADPGIYLSNSDITLNGKTIGLQIAYQQDDFWNASNPYFKYCQATALTDTSRQPEYLIEQLPNAIEPGESLEANRVREKIYRITAHGFGSSDAAQASLQTTYKQ